MNSIDEQDQTEELPTATPPPVKPRRKKKEDQTGMYVLGLSLAVVLMIVPPLMKGATLADARLLGMAVVTLVSVVFVASQAGFGAALITAGIMVTGFFAIFYNTSVDGYNNIGLMNDRMIGVVVGLGTAMLGAVLHLATARK